MPVIPKISQKKKSYEPNKQSYFPTTILSRKIKKRLREWYFYSTLHMSRQSALQSQGKGNPHSLHTD